MLKSKSKSISCILNETDAESMMNVFKDTIITPLIGTPFFKSNNKMKLLGIKISFDVSNVVNDSDIVISFVGEIYNGNELYNLLFDSNEKHIYSNDTEGMNEELIVALYKKYGFDYMIQLLDGKFAFVLFDYSYLNDISKVYVVRDAFGVMPLYMFKRTNAFNPNEYYGFFTEKNNYLFVDDLVEIRPGTYHVYELPNKVSTHWTSQVFFENNIHTCNITTYYKLPATTISGVMDINYWHKCITESLYDSIKKRLWHTHNVDQDIVYLMTGIARCDTIVLRCLRKFLKHHCSENYKGNIHTYYLRETTLSDGYENVRDTLNIIKTSHTDIFISSDCDLSTIWSQVVTKHEDAYFLYSTGFREMIGYGYEKNSLFEYDKYCREELTHIKNDHFLNGSEHLFLDRYLLETFFNIPLEVREKHREHLFEYVRIAA